MGIVQMEMRWSLRRTSGLLIGEMLSSRTTTRSVLPVLRGPKLDVHGLTPGDTMEGQEDNMNGNGISVYGHAMVT